MNTRFRQYNHKSRMVLALFTILCWSGLHTAQAQNYANGIEASGLQISETATIISVVPDDYPDETGNLNAAVAEHKTGPDVIFELQRDGVYWLDVSLENENYRLHLRAEDGAGSPPIVRPGATSVSISSTEDVILEGIFFLNIDEDAGINDFFDFGGDGAVAVIDNCWTVGAVNNHIDMSGANTGLYITNSMVMNTGSTGNSQHGRFVNSGNTHQDVLYIENNTVYNLGHAFVRALVNRVIEHVHYNHNTVVNATQYAQIGSTPYANVTNNLFQNTGVSGETEENETAAWIELRDIPSGHAVVESDRQLNVSYNNIGFIHPDYHAFIEEQNQNDTENTILQRPNVSRRWMDPTNEYPLVTYEWNIEEEVAFVDPPEHETYRRWVQNYFRDRAGLNYPDERGDYDYPMHYDLWEEAPDDPTPGSYSVNMFRDYTYSDEHASFWAAENGYPLGDLNWFPELKEMWEQGLPAPAPEPEIVCSPDVTVVPPDNYPEEIGRLNTAVEQCLAEYPQTSFELQRDAVYWLDETLVVQDHDLHIRAREGAGEPPIVRMATTASDVYLVHTYQNSTFEGIYFLSINEDNGATRTFRIESEGKKFVFDNGYMNGNRNNFIELHDSGNSIYVTNSIIKNSGGQDYNTQWGRLLNNAGGPQSKIHLENNTVYNMGHAIMRMPTSGGSAEIDTIRINHNTLVNVQQYLAVGRVLDLEITNNLFKNSHVIGLPDDHGTQAIIELRPRTDGAERSLLISNNNIGYLDQEYLDLTTERNNLSSATILPAPIYSRSMDGSDDIQYLNLVDNIEEEVVFEDEPDLETYKRWIEFWMFDRINWPGSDPSDGIDHPMLYDRWDEAFDDPTPGSYTTAQFRDFSYSDKHKSYRAAEKGYPVGDLNWFPELKEMWEQGLPAPEPEIVCSPDVSVVPPDNYPEEIGRLNTAIEQCIAEYPQTSFELQRDGVYWLDGTIESQDFNLHLTAREGGGHPPIVRPATGERIIISEQDVLIEGIYLLGINEEGIHVDHFTHEGEDTDFVIDNSWLVGGESIQVWMEGSGNRFCFTNSVSKNVGNMENDQNGRLYDTRGTDQELIFIENSTMYNMGHALLRIPSGSLIDEIHFNHNTITNVQQYIALGRVLDLTLTNNLVINSHTIGLDSFNQSVGVFQIREVSGQELIIRNNNIGYWDQEYLDLIDQRDALETANILPAPIISRPFLNDLEFVSFANNFAEGVAFADPPDKDQYLDWTMFWLYNRVNDWPGPDPSDDYDFPIMFDRWDEASDDPTPGSYTVAQLRDFSYSDEHDSYTAAELGYPVGDLNWFPELKETWEQGLPAPGYVHEEITFANVSSPQEATIESGEEFTVYARVEAEGFTDNGESEDIQAWIGYNTSDVAPSASGWTWIEADFNSNYTGNGHEYMSEIGSELTVGTYYYASRFQLKDQAYVYGGYDGGFWDGENNVSGILNVIEETDAQTVDIPREFGLQQNYPNPFNPVTSIAYQVPQAAHVTIEIFNVVGQSVAILVNESRDAGYYQVTFDATRLASGMYIYRMQAGDFSKTRKLMLTK